MEHARQFYINGCWVEPSTSETADVINPATEQPITRIAMGGPTDIDDAVRAARDAFDGFAATSREERLELLASVIAVYEKRADDVAETVSAEMGAPIGLARTAHAPRFVHHLRSALRSLRDFVFEERIGSATVRHEPIGVCGLITPWNWPVNQIGAKVVPALAAGCTMVLKPSEIAPLNALIIAEVLHEAGVPAGVFNLVNGAGSSVGTAIAAHPAIDMVSFTGSTRVGIEVAVRAAPTVKRVTQELGGKSANILLDDVDLPAALTRDLAQVYSNSGQSCNACTRILVPAARFDEAAEVAVSFTAAVRVGQPGEPGVTLGPVASKAQFDKIQHMIAQGIDEGASLLCGGTGRPDGLPTGYFVRPTVFVDVDPGMTIAREEIFGPVVVLMSYLDENDAVAIANDSDYGLGGRVSSADPSRARAVARRLRTGMVHVNGASPEVDAPFGGYRRSGNGREWGLFGLKEYLEVKSIFGDQPDGRSG